MTVRVTQSTRFTLARDKPFPFTPYEMNTKGSVSCHRKCLASGVPNKSNIRREGKVVAEKSCTAAAFSGASPSRSSFPAFRTAMTLEGLRL
jgi:hypothetical protein